MEIKYSPYKLLKKTKLNATDASIDAAPFREGALIKVVEGNNWGVADLCPWPSLGDLSWKEEMKEEGNLFQRAVSLAKDDLKARKESRSLLHNKFIPNNYVVTDYKSFNFADPKYVGKTLKIKGDRSVDQLAKVINEIPAGIKIRLDFNNILDAAKFDKFLVLAAGSLSKIEYIEDPIPYDFDLWFPWNQSVPLAIDFQVKTADKSAYEFRITKPTRQRFFKLFGIFSSSQKMTITSAIEHPVGLGHALRIAQEVAQSESGLLTLDLYEKTAFHKYFTQKENELNFSELALNDVGIGMTEELNKLVWQEL
jgi:hypothetical protein